MKSAIDGERAQHLNLDLYPYTPAEGKPIVRICRGVVGLAT